MSSPQALRPFYILLTGPGHSRACPDIVLFPKKGQNEKQCFQENTMGLL